LVSTTSIPTKRRVGASKKSSSPPCLCEIEDVIHEKTLPQSTSRSSLLEDLHHQLENEVEKSDMDQNLKKIPKYMTNAKLIRKYETQFEVLSPLGIN